MARNRVSFSDGVSAAIQALQATTEPLDLLRLFRRLWLQHRTSAVTSALDSALDPALRQRLSAAASLGVGVEFGHKHIRTQRNALDDPAKNPWKRSGEFDLLLLFAVFGNRAFGSYQFLAALRDLSTVPHLPFVHAVERVVQQQGEQPDVKPRHVRQAIAACNRDGLGVPQHRISPKQWFEIFGTKCRKFKHESGQEQEEGEEEVEEEEEEEEEEEAASVGQTAESGRQGPGQSGSADAERSPTRSDATAMQKGGETRKAEDGGNDMTMQPTQTEQSVPVGDALGREGEENADLDNTACSTQHSRTGRAAEAEEHSIRTAMDEHSTRGHDDADADDTASSIEHFRRNEYGTGQDDHTSMSDMQDHHDHDDIDDTITFHDDGFCLADDGAPGTSLPTAGARGADSRDSAPCRDFSASQVHTNCFKNSLSPPSPSPSPSPTPSPPSSPLADIGIHTDINIESDSDSVMSKRGLAMASSRFAKEARHVKRARTDSSEPIPDQFPLRPLLADLPAKPQELARLIQASFDFFRPIAAKHDLLRNDAPIHERETAAVIYNASSVCLVLSIGDGRSWVLAEYRTATHKLTIHCTRPVHDELVAAGTEGEREELGGNGKQTEALAALLLRCRALLWSSITDGNNSKQPSISFNILAPFRTYTTSSDQARRGQMIDTAGRVAAAAILITQDRQIGSTAIDGHLWMLAILRASQFSADLSLIDRCPPSPPPMSTQHIEETIMEDLAQQNSAFAAARKAQGAVLRHARQWLSTREQHLRASEQYKILRTSINAAISSATAMRAQTSDDGLEDLRKQATNPKTAPSIRAGLQKLYDSEIAARAEPSTTLVWKALLKQFGLWQVDHTDAADRALGEGKQVNKQIRALMDETLVCLQAMGLGDSSGEEDGSSDEGDGSSDKEDD